MMTTDTNLLGKKTKVGGYKSSVLWAKRQRKRLEADERNLEHNSLSIEDRIAKAKSRRGESKREIARLTRMLPVGVKVVKEPKKETPPAPAAEPAPVKEKKAKVKKPAAAKKKAVKKKPAEPAVA